MTKSHTIPIQSSITPSQQKGFTLVELMITVVIVAIIAAVAIPSFRGQVLRSHRTDAKVTLADNAQKLERCYTEYNTYVYDAANAPGCPQTSDLNAANTGSDYYTFDITATATTFVITADVKTTQADDTNCKKFTLNQTGLQKAYNGGTDNSALCW